MPLNKFLRDMVFLSRVPAQWVVCPHAPLLLPSSCWLPEGAAPEPLGDGNSIFPPPCVFGGKGVAWRGLTCVASSWRGGLWECGSRLACDPAQRRESEPKPLAQGLAQGGGTVSLTTALVACLPLVRSCESPLSVCRNRIHLKWHQKAG